jgi:hypothetical protein
VAVHKTLFESAFWQRGAAEKERRRKDKEKEKTERGEAEELKRKQVRGIVPSIVLLRVTKVSPFLGD